MIHGRGSDHPAVMFIGRDPGYEEDQIGQVFVGPSGYLLDLGLASYQIAEELVYRTNIVRCRPLGNKLLQEAKRVSCCSAFLLEEITRLQPRILVPLGGVACAALTGKGAIREMHGRALEQDGRIVLPMYHPSAVLHDPSLQPVFDRDFALLRKVLVYGKVDPDPIDDGVLTDIGEVRAVFDEIFRRGYVAFDYETNTLKPWEHPSPRIGLLSLSLGSHRARALPLDPWQSPWESPWTVEQRAELAVLIRRMLTDPKLVREAHNAQYEHLMTAWCFGFEMGLTQDSMLAHAQLDENAVHNLDDLAWRFTDLGGYKEKFRDELPDPDNFLSAPLDRLGWYGCRDVVVTERVGAAVRAQLTPEQLTILRDVQEPLIPVLAGLVRVGKKVDLDAVKWLDAEWTALADGIEVELRAWPEVAAAEQVLAVQRADADAARMMLELRDLQADSEKAKKTARQKAIAWRLEEVAAIKARDPAVLEVYREPFNFRSDPQLRVLFLDPACLAYPYTRFTTETGEPSVGKDALVVWGEHDERPRLYRRYRRLRTIHSSFIAPMYEYLAKSLDGCVHAGYNQHIARTHRLSSSDPNEQNRPRDDTCAVLGAPPIQDAMYCSRFSGGEVVKADYSQLELRVLAVASVDLALLAAYEKGRDLHATTALGFFDNLRGVVSDEVFAAALEKAKQREAWKTERGIGKRCNFLTSYGGSAQRLQALLAEQGLFLPLEDCERYVELFFELYPGVRRYMRWVSDQAVAAGGVVVCADGSRRHLPALIHGEPGERAHAEREAGNVTIQWPAAKLTMIALSLLGQLLREEKMESLIVGTIHDSILVDSPAEEAEEVAELVKGAMELAAEDPRWMPAGWWNPRVPVIADVG